MHIPRVVIAGSSSGVGKTTLVTGLLSLLARKGLRVQPFKAGPDYIDPGFHTAACGRISRNLDPCWFDADGLRELFVRACAGADMALVEGVMGLFDGRSPQGDHGSSAHLASVLAAPVVLVADAWGMGRSAAALVHGFATFGAPPVGVAGVVFNRVAGERHYEVLRAAVEGATGIPVLGFIPRDSAITLPERHLGLAPAIESGKGGLARILDRLVSMLHRTVDTEALTRIASAAPPLPPFKRRIFDMDGGLGLPQGAHRHGAERAGHPPCRLALALDEAFHFYYQDGLDYLQACGAELVPFSLLRGSGLPDGVDGVYIGGGFPEVFAEGLAANQGMLLAVRRAAAAGMPIYAECGGLIYLSEGVVTADGERYPLAGVIPGWCVMDRRAAGLGYAEGRLLRDSLLGREGDVLRGHEFHYSRWQPAGPVPEAYLLCSGRRQGERDGFAQGGVMASYLHIHFAANPKAAQTFADACRAYRSARLGQLY